MNLRDKAVMAYQNSIVEAAKRAEEMQIWQTNQNYESARQYFHHLFGDEVEYDSIVADPKGATIRTGDLELRYFVYGARGRDSSTEMTLVNTCEKCGGTYFSVDIYGLDDLGQIIAESGSFPKNHRCLPTKEEITAEEIEISRDPVPIYHTDPWYDVVLALKKAVAHAPMVSDEE